ncbi:RmlC cupins superfamily protein [Salix suchowensis]|nr:RmlC cupins superfamily protein [Salix suchowensis]
MVIAGNDSIQIQKLKQYLSTCFSIKDLGTLKYFLGLELARSPQGISLCQRKYTLDLLKETGMASSKPVAFPIPQNHRLSSDCGDPLQDPRQYRRLIGRLIYLTISHPDITYGVQLLSQFMQKPCQPHLDAAYHVLRYLKSSPGQGLFFPSQNDLQIKAYCDADWASCPMTRRSITGFYIFLGTAPISWKSKKQPTVSRSSAESEYRSMAATTSELIWLHSLLADLSITHSQPMSLHCDN